VKTANCNSKNEAQHTSTVGATWWAAETLMHYLTMLVILKTTQHSWLMNMSTEHWWKNADKELGDAIVFTTNITWTGFIL